MSMERNGSESTIESTQRAAVAAGLFPPLKPLDPDIHLRDTIIIRGGDGMYYMTGSSGDDIWDHNDGVELWKSSDLHQWDYVGLIWSIDKDWNMGKRLALASQARAGDLGAGNSLHQEHEELLHHHVDAAGQSRHSKEHDRQA